MLNLFSLGEQMREVLQMYQDIYIYPLLLLMLMLLLYLVIHQKEFDLIFLLPI